MSIPNTADTCQCASGFIHVLDWTRLDQEHWWLRTRCAECGSFRDFVVDRSQAEALEEGMRAAEQEISAQAEWWARNGMTEWAGRGFSPRCDAVAPMDF
jgi:hypothetical protein